MERTKAGKRPTNQWEVKSSPPISPACQLKGGSNHMEIPVGRKGIVMLQDTGLRNAMQHPPGLGVLQVEHYGLLLVGLWQSFTFPCLNIKVKNLVDLCFSVCLYFFVSLSQQGAKAVINPHCTWPNSRWLPSPYLYRIPGQVFRLYPESGALW